MFPSTNYTSSSPSYPCFPSSSSSSPHPPFTFLNPDNSSSSNTTFLHDPLSVITYMPSHHNYHVPQIPEANWTVADHNAAAMFNQDLSGALYGNFSKKAVKKSAKKDRHSKIHTSQGLRDRRVRLSIEISRKFFDLQDMLGFDKASNTLEWLLTKSKKAIKELTHQTKHSSSGSFFSSADGEVVSMIHQNLQQEEEEEEPVYGVMAKMKEPREKSRARARERANSKNLMCDLSARGLNKKCPETEINPQILKQLRPHTQVGSAEGSRGDDLLNVFEESIVIKRKSKQSLMSSSIHQNLVVIPKEASVNNSDYHSFPNFSPSWEPNSATGRSNICSITSMNLSTGLQIFGKSWEECTNHHPC